MKRMISAFLALLLLVNLLPLNTLAAETTTGIGIDVSHHQGKIDWETVKPQIDFAMIRCGEGMDGIPQQDDAYWEYNASECERLEIPYGVYLYSYAITPERAKSEAQHAIRLLEGHSPSLPVYYDIESESIRANCTNQQILEYATIFCDMLEKAGYTVGIYSNYNWWTTNLTDSKYDQWERWIARYNTTVGYSKKLSIWQYTKAGAIDGIVTPVDLNRAILSYTKPTCTKDGKLTYAVSSCDTYTEILPKTGHTYTKKVIKPTYAAQGYTLYTCSVCKAQVKKSYTDKLTVSATALSSVTNVKGQKITVKWKKNTKVTGYQVQYSTDKSFKKGVKTVTVNKNSIVSTTISKLTKKKTYYVRIRSYVTQSKKDYYSAWSKAKSVTVKK